MADRDERNRSSNAPQADDLDAPPTAEEIAAAERLREALAGAPSNDPEAILAQSLRAAWSPSSLEAEGHDSLVELSSASPEELAAAASLEEALRNAWNPRELSEQEHRTILERALGPEVSRPQQRRKSSGNVIRIAFGATASALALAAGIALVLSARPSAPDAELARSRSTAPLFDAPFRADEGSARIDRIAVARVADFRENRFSTWGIR